MTSSVSTWHRAGPRSIRCRAASHSRSKPSGRRSPPRARRGRARAGCARPLGSSSGRLVSAPRRRAPHTAPAAPRRRAAARAGRITAPPTARCCSRCLRPAGASSGASSASRLCPRRRSSAGGRRARPASPGRCGRSPTCAPATTSSTRTTASASCSASRRRRSAGITRDYLLLAFRGRRPAVRAARSGGQGLALRRRRRRRAPLSKLGGRAWQLLKTRAGHAVRELAGELLALYAQREHAAGVSLRPLERLAGTARSVVPVPRDARPAGGDRGGEGGPRVGAADGPARLRRRRLRQDGDRRPRRLRGRRSTAGRRSCSHRRRCSRNSTGTRSASATATSRSRSRWSRASASRRR